MAVFVSSATMSLDGFVANPDDTVEPLFEWFDAGDVELASANPAVSFHLHPASAEYWRSWTGRIGCVVVGRRLFDITDGWGGTHPLGGPVVVVTHRAPEAWAPPGSEDFRFVTSGIRDAFAVAGALAGDRVVAVAAGTIAGQALEADLLDEVAIDLVPVALGEGRRYFGDARFPAVRLGAATTHIAAPGVTHLVHPRPPRLSPGAARPTGVHCTRADSAALRPQRDQPVEDQDRALRFYRDVLGFEVRRDVVVGDGARWLEVAPPGSEVTIALVATDSGVPQGVRLGTTHIDPLHETLQRDEADVDDAVMRAPYAPAMFTVRDPDGNSVVLVELPGD